MNPRIPAIDPSLATESVAQNFAAVKSKLGAVPNLFRTFAQSPAVLDAYLGFSGALTKGALSAPVREQLALVIGEENGCDYCLAAHTLIGRTVGLTPNAIEDARRGEASDPKTAAILAFARKVLAKRGAVCDDALAAAREAGVTDAELVEIVAHVALNVLTNYTNNLAHTDVDFPRAKPLTPAAV